MVLSLSLLSKGPDVGSSFVAIFGCGALVEALIGGGRSTSGRLMTVLYYCIKSWAFRVLSCACLFIVCIELRVSGLQVQVHMDRNRDRRNPACSAEYRCVNVCSIRTLWPELVCSVGICSKLVLVLPVIHSRICETP